MTPLKAGHFCFNPEVFTWANAGLESSLDANLIIIDEYGPLERDGKGFYPAIVCLKKRFNGMLLISVRPGLVDDLWERIVLPTSPKR